MKVGRGGGEWAGYYISNFARAGSVGVWVLIRLKMTIRWLLIGTVQRGSTFILPACMEDRQWDWVSISESG